MNFAVCFDLLNSGLLIQNQNRQKSANITVYYYQNANNFQLNEKTLHLLSEKKNQNSHIQDWEFDLMNHTFSEKFRYFILVIKCISQCLLWTSEINKKSFKTLHMTFFYKYSAVVLILVGINAFLALF